MSYATLAALKTGISSPSQPVPITIGATTTVAGRPYDLWTTAAPVGVAPTTAVNPDRTTAGALEFQNPNTYTVGIDIITNDLQVVGARFSSLAPGQYLICDRQAHMGGLSGTVTTAQTCGISASGRNSTGVGCFLGVTIYTQIGTTATTIMADYYDAGASSRQTATVAIGGTGFREANRLILLPLDPAASDLGCTYVPQVTLAGTTGTAGNFGVMLFRPLFAILVPDGSGVTQAAGFITGYTCGGLPKIPVDACLFAVAISMSTSAAGAGAILLDETAP